MFHYTNDRIHRAPNPAAFSGRVLVAAAIVGLITLACGSRELHDPGTDAAALPGSGEPIAAATSTAATTSVDAMRLLSPLRSAAAFGILAGSGISCAISGTVIGASGPSNIGSSPTSTVTGFAPCTFSGSIPLPAVVARAKADLSAAYLAAQGKECNSGVTGFDLGYYDGSTFAKTLPPGTYCFAESASLTGTLRLTGLASARWTFQIGTTLDADYGSNVILGGGASADNVYWAVGSSATLMTNAAFQGNILALGSITMQNGATLVGRALAQTGAVDLTAGAATITKP